MKNFFKIAQNNVLKTNANKLLLNKQILGRRSLHINSTYKSPLLANNLILNGHKSRFSIKSALLNKKIEDGQNKITENTQKVEETSTPTHELLAVKEQEANRSLGDSKVQADFYKLLLKSGYAQYVISRYETPGIATSPECMGLYMEALTNVGRHVEANNIKQALLGKPTETVDAASGQGEASAKANTFAQAQPVMSQAAAPIMNPMFGTAKEPMHVVLTESTFTMVFRVVRYIVTLGLLLYLLNEGVKFLTENSTLFKNNEVTDNDHRYF